MTTNYIVKYDLNGQTERVGPYSTWREANDTANEQQDVAGVESVSIITMRNGERVREDQK